MRRRAGALLAVDLEPPDEPAGLYHNYFCPDHAVELRFDPRTPRAHVCPVDGRVWSGSPFDEAWRFGANHLLAHGALQAALLWRLDGDARAADRAAAVLTGYARRYPEYPLGTHTSRGGGRGKATYQSLDEANIIVPLARAYDLLRERLPAADRELIEGDLLRLAASHIRAQRFHEVHNIECWHHAALAAVGTAVGDDALVDEAIDGAFGFRRLLRDGLADGLWWECSSSYHFYAAHALTTLAAVVAAARPECAHAEELRLMYAAPLAIRMPDGRLPATNDCWFFSSLRGDLCHGVPPACALYEVAAGWFGDPDFHAVLAENYRSRPRDSMEALLYGPDEVQAAGSGAGDVGANGTGSVSLPDIGLSVLRQRHAPGSPDSWVLLKHGPPGGGHGHPDKLALSLYAAGEPVSPDLGSPGYGVPLHRSWYRQSFSHNTVILDRRSQPPARGELIGFERAPDGPDQVQARVRFGAGGAGAGDDEEALYAGTTMARAVASDGRCFLDWFSVRSPGEHVVQWLFRVRGALARLRGTAAGGLAADIPHVSVRESGIAAGAAAALWHTAGGWVALHLPREAGGSVAVGDAPFNPASELTDLLVRTRQGRAADFLTVVETGGADSEPARIEWEEATGSLVIRRDDGEHRWRLPDADGAGWRAG
uniref:Uncharacterized protein n=1 Tax=bacterium symbiont of Plakortis simplex pPSA11D7 TaxID=1256903 RepID=V5JAF3_UNCXX|nr:hypothetical protein [bacterium symbiont of Plakortis simplex pPSA11D7]